METDFPVEVDDERDHYAAERRDQKPVDQKSDRHLPKRQNAQHIADGYDTHRQHALSLTLQPEVGQTAEQFQYGQREGRKYQRVEQDDRCDEPAGLGRQIGHDGRAEQQEQRGDRRNDQRVQSVGYRPAEAVVWIFHGQACFRRPKLRKKSGLSLGSFISS